MGTEDWVPEELPLDETGPAICIMILPCIFPVEDAGFLI